MLKKTSHLLMCAVRHWSSDKSSHTGAALAFYSAFSLAPLLIGIYLAHSTQPSAFGAASSFAALLLWLYYTAQIFLFGAEFTACLGGIRHSAPRPGVSRPASPPAF
jgi:uncharacterized BrkB/YihY/UPF0761 family membrane protein